MNSACFYLQTSSILVYTVVSSTHWDLIVEIEINIV